jgi:aspartyl-tRNA(Asn)/glutamyl-tRNA(Gln) amidotransferase subunit B
MKPILQGFEMVIGLEVHCQLKTQSKLFCGCSTRYVNQPPNTHVCPVCLGHPGVLPVLNQEVLAMAVKTCLALQCQLPKTTKFDRKHYFYPDLPKAYQISQFDLPIGEHGCIQIQVEHEDELTIGVTRIHMEEDAGKTLHSASGSSLVDYNRAAVPLLEIVSEPELSGASQARAYLEKLRRILQYLEVGDCEMENGSLRCDVNISIRKQGTQPLGTKVEIKNLNSFRSVGKSIEHEFQRQVSILTSQGSVSQETRLWDEDKGSTRLMRSKEQAEDYRYFPEPDLLPITLETEFIQRIRSEIPELPDSKRKRLEQDYSLSTYNANLLSDSKELAQYFEESCKVHSNPVTLSNWILTELLAKIKEESISLNQCKVSPTQLGALVALIDGGKISGKIAKQVFEECFSTGEEPESIVQKKGLTQISDSTELEKIVETILAENQKIIEDLRQGKKQALGFVMGQIMKATRGQANPSLCQSLIRKVLSHTHGIQFD